MPLLQLSKQLVFLFDSASRCLQVQQGGAPQPLGIEFDQVVHSLGSICGAVLTHLLSSRLLSQAISERRATMLQSMIMLLSASAELG